MESEDEQVTADLDLTVRGVGREADDQRCVVLFFNRRLTDNELRWLHDHLRKGIPHRFRVGNKGCLDCDYDPMVAYD